MNTNERTDKRHVWRGELALLIVILINCIFRRICASVPKERSAIPLETEQRSVGN